MGWKLGKSDYQKILLDGSLLFNPISLNTKCFKSSLCKATVLAPVQASITDRLADMR